MIWCRDSSEAIFSPSHLTTTNLSGLLLSHTMNSTESPNKINRMNANNRAILDQLAQQAQRYAVVRIVEGWHQHRRVRDVEVSIARGKPLIVEHDRRRHRKRNRFDL